MRVYATAPIIALSWPYRDGGGEVSSGRRAITTPLLLFCYLFFPISDEELVIAYCVRAVAKRQRGNRMAAPPYKNTT